MPQPREGVAQVGQQLDDPVKQRNLVYYAAAPASSNAVPKGHVIAEVTVVANHYPGLLKVLNTLKGPKSENLASHLLLQFYQGGPWVSPNRFEELVGLKANKKWRHSIKVYERGKTPVAVGTWLGALSPSTISEWAKSAGGKSGPVDLCVQAVLEDIKQLASIATARGVNAPKLPGPKSSGAVGGGAAGPSGVAGPSNKAAPSGIAAASGVAAATGVAGSSNKAAPSGAAGPPTKAAPSGVAGPSGINAAGAGITSPPQAKPDTAVPLPQPLAAKVGQAEGARAIASGSKPADVEPQEADGAIEEKKKKKNKKKKAYADAAAPVEGAQPQEGDGAIGKKKKKKKDKKAHGDKGKEATDPGTTAAASAAAHAAGPSTIAAPVMAAQGARPNTTGTGEGTQSAGAKHKEPELDAAAAPAARSQRQHIDLDAEHVPAGERKRKEPEPDGEAAPAGDKKHKKCKAPALHPEPLLLHEADQLQLGPDQRAYPILKDHQFRNTIGVFCNGVEGTLTMRHVPHVPMFRSEIVRCNVPIIICHCQECNQGAVYSLQNFAAHAKVDKAVCLKAIYVPAQTKVPIGEWLVRRGLVHPRGYKPPPVSDDFWVIRPDAAVAGAGPLAAAHAADGLNQLALAADALKAADDQEAEIIAHGAGDDDEMQAAEEDEAGADTQEDADMVTVEEWNAKMAARECMMCHKKSGSRSMLLCDADGNGEDGKCVNACHLKCCGLKRIPKGEWYCSVCAAK